MRRAPAKKGRRKVVRVPASLPVEWGLTAKYEHHGKITSLSHGGFLVGTDAVQPLYEKTIHFRVPLPEREWCEVRGRVIYHLRDTGFGVEFDAPSDEGSATPRRLMQRHRENPPDAWGRV